MLATLSLLLPSQGSCRTPSNRKRLGDQHLRRLCWVSMRNRKLPYLNNQKNILKVRLHLISEQHQTTNLFKTEKKSNRFLKEKKTTKKIPEDNKGIRSTARSLQVNPTMRLLEIRGRRGSNLRTRIEM